MVESHYDRNRTITFIFKEKVHVTWYQHTCFWENRWKSAEAYIVCATNCSQTTNTTCEIPHLFSPGKWLQCFIQSIIWGETFAYCILYSVIKILISLWNILKLVNCIPKRYIKCTKAIKQQFNLCIIKCLSNISS